MLRPGFVKRAGVVALVCATVAAVWCASHGYRNTLDWPTDMTAAVRIASSERKPLLAAFHANWCPVCRRMEQSTYRDPAVRGELTRFVTCRVDVDQDPVSARAVGVTVLPLLVVFSPDGEVLYRHAGYVSGPDLRKVLAGIGAPVPTRGGKRTKQAPGR